ncbi:hypothetical protein [Nocardiopsis sp. CNR-923]|uniref:hypothetical protein n=1 Tax=Nocardiopsis sp. CNR-923 TaxID=1904965 RepID=UPI001300E1A5|nr:hypothetical protein [Nocardiopsis sp. CNR-923]
MVETIVAFAAGVLAVHGDVGVVRVGGEGPAGLGALDVLVAVGQQRQAADRFGRVLVPVASSERCHGPLAHGPGGVLRGAAHAPPHPLGRHHPVPVEPGGLYEGGEQLDGRVTPGGQDAHLVRASVASDDDGDEVLRDEHLVAVAVGVGVRKVGHVYLSEGGGAGGAGRARPRREGRG